MKRFLTILAAMTALSAPSLAADLPPIDEVVETAESNWYVTLHGGYKFSEDWDDDIDFGTYPYYGHDIHITGKATASTDSGWRAGASVGYQFSPLLGAELEVAHISQDFDKIKGDSLSIQVDDDPPKVIDISDLSADLNGDLGIWTIMANALVGIPINGWVRPYVGVGAGVARVNVDVGISDPDICCLDDSDWTFALQGMAGVDFRLTDSMSLGGRFRLLNVGEAELKDDGGFKHNLNPDWMSSVEAVLRFDF